MTLGIPVPDAIRITTAEGRAGLQQGLLIGYMA